MLEDVAGLDAIELGCGTAYVSAWLARRGARPVGIDNSPRQLETARRLQAEHALEFPLLLGNAESVPLPDASFDLAISEYGAATWADPFRWVPEAARLLRPGGRLHFLKSSPLLLCSAAPTPRMQRPSSRFSAPSSGCIASNGRTTIRGVQHRPWRDGQAAARERLRDPGSDRDPGPGRLSRPRQVRDSRSGPAAGPAKRSGRPRSGRSVRPGGRGRAREPTQARAGPPSESARNHETGGRCRPFRRVGPGPRASCRSCSGSC